MAEAMKLGSGSSCACLLLRSQANNIPESPLQEAPEGPCVVIIHTHISFCKQKCQEQGEYYYYRLMSD